MTRLENQPRLYHELAEWWPLLSDPADYAAEVAAYWPALASASTRPIATLLELGAGGGNNALHFKKHARLTLTDLSEAMLAVSRGINPECEHIAGDMLTLRLGRRFDAVFVHDAVMYLTTHTELAALAATIRAHVSPGGAWLIAPDCTRESYGDGVTTGGSDTPDARRGLRYLEWTHDPDPRDDEYFMDMVYMLRDGADMHIAQDRHRFGVFRREVWLRELAAAGLPARHVSFEFGGEGFVGTVHDQPSL